MGFSELLWPLKIQAYESSVDPRISADLAAPRTDPEISPELMRNFGQKILGGWGVGSQILRLGY